MRILDAETAREVWSLEGHALRVDDADFSPDGLRLATASLDQTVRSLGPGHGTGNPEAGRSDPLSTAVGFVSGGRRLIGGTMTGGFASGTPRRCRSSRGAGLAFGVPPIRSSGRS